MDKHLNKELDRFMNHLIQEVQKGNVVPIIGQELYEIQHNGSTFNLYQYLAKKLAEIFNVNCQELPNNVHLNHIIMKAKPSNICDVHYEMNNIIRELNIDLPNSLEKLAEINDFNLFITTTFDSLLKKAVDKIRFNSQSQTKHLAFNINQPDDIEPNWNQDHPVVYGLFGKATELPDYVISDEDQLEFMHALQDREYRPKNLFSYLQNKHILIIGSNHSNWLARFFLRIINNVRLSEPKNNKIFFNHLSDNELLNQFLDSNQVNNIRRLQHNNPIDFVDRLYKKWSQTKSSTNISIEPFYDINKDYQIFLSYAREDEFSVKKIYDLLIKTGLSVWFDRHELDPGETFKKSIEYQIKSCRLFIPILSINIQKKKERFLFYEWNLAKERKKFFPEFGKHSDDQTFIMPIFIDDSYSHFNDFEGIHMTNFNDDSSMKQFIRTCVRICKG